MKTKALTSEETKALVKAVNARVREVLKEMLPEGVSVEVDEKPWIGFNLCCSGSIPIMNYYCCYRPGHKGKCFSRVKRVSFKPEVW